MVTRRVLHVLPVFALVALAGCRTPPRSAPHAPAPAKPRADGLLEAYATVLRDVVRTPQTTRYVVDPSVSAARGGPLPADFRADLPLEWFGEADATNAGASLWTELHRRYGVGQGWTRFERTDVSASGRWLTFRLTHSLGPLSATSWSVRLERTPQGWTVISKDVIAQA